MIAYWALLIAFAILIEIVDSSFNLWRLALLCFGAYPLFTFFFGLKLYGSWGGPYSYSKREDFLMLITHHMIGILLIFFAVVG